MGVIIVENGDDQVCAGDVYLSEEPLLKEKQITGFSCEASNIRIGSRISVFNAGEESNSDSFVVRAIYDDGDSITYSNRPERTGS